ncbi:MAG: RsmB/NOP family class I SAM-dependent RNA methyltransferase [Spirochaetales bacterium]|nr:RsmB/NOP family class I SAM-dependent RNA methyltransferase [Spirochaetales bacterium]
MAKKEKKSGELLFEEYYGKRWGDRWPILRESLFTEIDHYHLTEGLLQPYFLDEASLYPARELDVREGEEVLDMCAAPGGKSLILAAALKGTGSLTLNDLSPDRRRRLRQVMENHLIPEWQKNIRYTGFDGSLWYRHEPSRFDKILLDAPCSSERHVLNSPEHLKKWTPGRIKSLAPRQFSLLCSALDAVKPGGLIVYSTCALAEEENDLIIERLLKKRNNRFQVEPPLYEKGEDTRFGRHILPDRETSGPIYYCRIRRLSEG